MAIYVEGIIGRIGIDAENLGDNKCSVNASYPQSFPYSNESGSKEMKTLFMKDDIRLYKPTSQGGVSKIQMIDLPAAEYTFNAMIMELPTGSMRASDIVVTNIKE